MKIAEGIYRIDGINGNVYLVEDGENLTLIDTGLPRRDKKILEFIESLGIKTNRRHNNSFDSLPY